MIRGKESWFQITRDIGMLLTLQVCSVFYLMLRTQTVHLEVSFTIYSALSTPSLFFSVRFVRTFERLAKTFQFLKIIHSRYSRSYFNLSLISLSRAMPVKLIQTFTYNVYKNSCHSSKDRLDTKILSQFSKLPDKNLSLVLFYHLKT